MPRASTLTKAEYKRRAKLLRRYGFKVRLNPKTPAQKATLTRQWGRVSKYAERGKQAKKNNFAFKFVRTPTKKKQDIVAGLHPATRTPKGVFVRVPTNVRSYRVKWERNALKVEAVGLRGGRRVERVAKLDARGLIKDAGTEIRRVTNKLQGRGTWKSAKLVVNGYDAAMLKSMKGERGGWDTPEQWFHYFDRFFSTAVTGTDSISTFHGKPGKLSARQFAEIFHVKVITQSPSTERTPSPRKKKRSR